MVLSNMLECPPPPIADRDPLRVAVSALFLSMTPSDPQVRGYYCVRVPLGVA
jgi:hypothetical protein